MVMRLERDMAAHSIQVYPHVFAAMPVPLLCKVKSRHFAQQRMFRVLNHEIMCGQFDDEKKTFSTVVRKSRAKRLSLPVWARDGLGSVAFFNQFG